MLIFSIAFTLVLGFGVGLVQHLNKRRHANSLAEKLIALAIVEVTNKTAPYRHTVG